MGAAQQGAAAAVFDATKCAALHKCVDSTACERPAATGQTCSFFSCEPPTQGSMIPRDQIIIGAPTAHLNGTYLRVQGLATYNRPVYRRKPTSSVHEVRDRSGKAVATLKADPEQFLFYGEIWKAKRWGRGRARGGWFVSEKRAESRGVQNYLYRNLSDAAMEPGQCTAAWEINLGAGRVHIQSGMACVAAGRQQKDEREEVFHQTYAELDRDEWCDDCKASWQEVGPPDGADIESESEEETVPPADAAKFQDVEFPPTSKSLGSDANCGTWARLSDDTSGHGCLFAPSGVWPDHVPQVAAMRRWLAGACAVMACYPAWLQSSVFRGYSQIAVHGRYRIRLYDPRPEQQKFALVQIDDQMPLVLPGDDGASQYALANQQSGCWVALVEKAMAKLLGCFDNLKFGQVAWGLVYLCGGEGERWDLNMAEGRWHRSVCSSKGDQNKRRPWEGMEQQERDLEHRHAWAALEKYSSLNFPMSCGFAGDAMTKRQMHEGFPAPGLTYGLLAAVQVKDISGLSLRLLKLANPHGANAASAWGGRWSSQSLSWIEFPNVSEALGYNPRSDSNEAFFWISFSDFIKKFDGFCVVKKRMPLQGCQRDKIISVPQLASQASAA
eukprot:gnl/TRDRNA2_/TRDRNA2_158326_c0_seq2.p1 gnl/TRDRNA2_/TRDRNA2_158326_c0~~gnl/TRDRNA2_/TRDRNA2_158326_c0_seq2.p1  ORF type:complete len:650 (+),score=75.01 gnl/TRDRNA2_/TRDRNA2_158326_c0_seq2:115-1950(+)